jgi:hypothetical protein
LLPQQQDFEILVAVLRVAQYDNVEKKHEEKTQEGIGHPAINLSRLLGANLNHATDDGFHQLHFQQELVF